jgi:translation initiation factor 1
MKNRLSSGGLVYSTESGRMCPGCRQPLAECLCGQKVLPQGDGILRVSRETKGRGGKTVTLVRGEVQDDAALQALGKRLKAACGTGGTVKDGVIEIQGDHVARVVDALAAEGHQVRRAGG